VRLFLRLLFADLVHHKTFHPAKFFLKAVGEIVRAVFKKNDKAEREKDKQGDPKDPAQQRHGASLTEAQF
jgi:hypothetical protein